MVHRIGNPEQVRRLLNRERSRSHRGSREFSFVLFRLDEGESSLLSRLVRLITLRVRISDEVGWFDDKQICAILPDTGVSGACAFARSICELGKRKSLSVTYEVYHYPPVQGGGEGDSMGSPLEISMLRVDGSRRSHPKSSVPDTRELKILDSPASFKEHQKAQDDQDDIRSMQEIFLERLPWWKRTIDILGALSGLGIFSPVLLIAAIGIKLTSRGPVFFRQSRAGLGGRPFILYKLRTMAMDAEERKQELVKYSEQDGPAFKMTNDPRITSFGRILRKTSLDELPQLWNVLVGDMSLVGPRPLPVGESKLCDGWHLQRLDVTPGITGLWQVSGRSRVAFNEWMRMDIRYVRSRNAVRDFLLLIRTIPIILLAKGK